MPEEKEYLQLCGTVEHIVFRNEKNQYTVLEVDDGEELQTVVGVFPYVSPGEELHIYGNWTQHSSFGPQFKAEVFDRVRPETTAAILRYLSSGAIKGIGASTARKIVDTFGAASLDVIENDPKRLSQIKGISEDKAVKIAEELHRIYGIRELMAYVSPFGITPEEAVRIWKLFGTDAIENMKADPYCICGEYTEISFEKADRMASSMEQPQDSPVRVRAGILHVLRHNTGNGHSCLPADKLCEAAARMLDVPLTMAQENLVELCRGYQTFCEKIEDRDFIFLPAYYRAERFSAERLKMLLKYPPKPIFGVEEEIAQIEKTQGITYADKQKEAIRCALDRGVLILTGGPGTGKTTTLNAIIRILKQKGETVFLGAPTGRAAKRMSDLTGEEAKTIHRMLQVDWDESDLPVFTRNEHNPLECDAVVIDELSMVDVLLLEGVLKALPLGCRLILVGDSDQLPSVGAGNVLGDLLGSGLLPTVRLTEIFRQSQKSLIVTNAHAIVGGKMPELREKTSDFFFLPMADAEMISQTIQELCSRRLPKSYGYSPLEDVQVLAPNKRGQLGTLELNRSLQAILNPPSSEKAELLLNGTVLREGDKVMQIKNEYTIPWVRTDGQSGEGVFNGDVGLLTKIDKHAGALTVHIDDKDVYYELEKAATDLELAYAVTVHKSQGNEFNAVIIPMYPGPPQLYFRNLLYTAITRAKKLLILVGQSRIVEQMVENDRKTRRYSGLLHFLNEENDPLQLKIHEE